MCDGCGFSHFTCLVFIRRFAGRIHQVLLAPVSATLDTFDVNTIYVALQGEVSPASLACFGSDETEHVPPLTAGHFGKQVMS